ncbi:MAG: cupredoxin domain-containing protein [Candidatus Limnocylindria bacterium]
MRRGAGYLGALLLVGLVVAACVAEAVLPNDCNAAAVQRATTLNGDHLDPQTIDVCKGQQVTLKVTTQRAGEIHLHGYDVEAPEVKVEPGDTATFKFKATRPGQFIIELHTPNEGPEIQVGLLTVHEP